MIVLIWFVFFIYSLLITFALIPLWLSRHFSKTLKKQMAGRHIFSMPHSLARLGRGQDTWLFFCSSAGEYEQAKPIIDRGLEKGFRAIIIFFSESGFRFAEKRKESVPFYLSPPDTIWHWWRWFEAIRPHTIFVVRHEVWPAFMFMGSRYAKIFLIDVELNPQKSKLKHNISRFLFLFAKGIFVVSEDDKNQLAKLSPSQKDKIFVVGDTKFDRVYERTLSSGVSIDSINVPGNHWRHCPQLIVGSAWVPDVEIVARAFCQIIIKMPAWLLVVVPHDLSQYNINKIFALLTELGLKPKILKENFDDFIPGKDGNAIIIEKMGVLAELYREAKLAFIGGGCHYRVHNVLEPAVFGLPIACGPHFDFSPEARLLVKAGLLQVISHEKDVFQWWQKWQNSQCFRDDNLVAALQELRGAADRIVAQIT